MRLVHCYCNLIFIFYYQLKNFYVILVAQKVEFHTGIPRVVG